MVNKFTDELRYRKLLKAQGDEDNRSVSLERIVARAFKEMLRKSGDSPKYYKYVDFYTVKKFTFQSS